MAYRFHRTLLLRPPLRLVKNSRSTQKLSRSFYTCTVKEDLFEPIQSKPSPRDCLPIKRSFVLTARRGHQTLSSDFGAHLPSVKQMENFLSARKILFEHGHTSLIACCPFCTEGGDGSEKTKAFTLYINKTTGSHFCKNCNASGTWQKFKVFLTQLLIRGAKGRGWEGVYLITEISGVPEVLHPTCYKVAEFSKKNRYKVYFYRRTFTLPA